MFTDQDIGEINKTVSLFPVAAEIAVAKISDGTVSYYGAIKSKDSIKEKNNKYSIFEIGSITKLFTSALLSQMIIEGKVSLDEDISLKLGFPLKNDIKINYKELSTHTSGLPSIPFKLLIRLFLGKNENPYKDFSEETLVHYLKNELRLKKKGPVRYSNIGAGLLGYILSKHSNNSYDGLLKQNLLSSLHMGDTTTIREEILDRLVTGLSKKGKPATNWDLNILAGAGAGLSSVADLSKFVMANIDEENKALNNQLHCTFEVGKQTMGLGWFILKNKIPGIDEAYFHNGGTGGYRSSMVVNLKKGTGVIILSNISGLYFLKSNKVDNLAFNLLQNI